MTSVPIEQSMLLGEMSSGPLCSFEFITFGIIPYNVRDQDATFDNIYYPVKVCGPDLFGRIQLDFKQLPFDGEPHAFASREDAVSLVRIMAAKEDFPEYVYDACEDSAGKLRFLFVECKPQAIGLLRV